MIQRNLPLFTSQRAVPVAVGDCRATASGASPLLHSLFFVLEDNDICSCLQTMIFVDALVSLNSMMDGVYLYCFDDGLGCEVSDL